MRVNLVERSVSGKDFKRNLDVCVKHFRRLADSFTSALVDYFSCFCVNDCLMLSLV